MIQKAKEPIDEEVMVEVTPTTEIEMNPFGLNVNDKGKVIATTSFTEKALIPPPPPIGPSSPSDMPPQVTSSAPPLMEVHHLTSWARPRTSLRLFNIEELDYFMELSYLMGTLKVGNIPAEAHNCIWFKSFIHPRQGTPEKTRRSIVSCYMC
ncbi:hypothetical protein ACFE04_019995 [Oxalis oulophora]